MKSVFAASGVSKSLGEHLHEYEWLTAVPDVGVVKNAAVLDAPQTSSHYQNMSTHTTALFPNDPRRLFASMHVPQLK